MQLDAFRVAIDWRAYFRAFCEAHGGDPVPFRGRLLFRDAWTYSSTDYRGPEWPPPDDPAPWIRAYWLIRIKLARMELRTVEFFLEGLASLKAGRSGPLYRKPLKGEEGPQLLDASPAEVRAKFLREDIARSEVELCTIRSQSTS